MPRVRASVFLFAGLPALVGACGGHLGPRPMGGAGAGGEGGDATGDPAGMDGTPGAGGAPGTTGAGGAAGADSAHFGEPACEPRVTAGGTCTPADAQFCYKPCGPEGVGVKSETCQSSGLYTEMVGCSYDLSLDYSCYKIPAEPDLGCAGGQAPQAGKPCDVAPCTPCNNRGGTRGGEYASGGGGIAAGWCVCQEANASGERTWSCANANMWPCPIGAGC